MTSHFIPSTERIRDKCTQPPLLEFEGFFTIRPFDGWNLWMENAHGEGTTIRKAEFLHVLAQLFERNF